MWLITALTFHRLSGIILCLFNNIMSPTWWEHAGHGLWLTEWNRLVTREMIIEGRKRSNASYRLCGCLDFTRLQCFPLVIATPLIDCPEVVLQNNLSICLFMAGSWDLNENVKPQRISMSQSLGQNVLRIVSFHTWGEEVCVYSGHMLLIEKLDWMSVSLGWFSGRVFGIFSSLKWSHLSFPIARWSLPSSMTEAGMCVSLRVGVCFLKSLWLLKKRKRGRKRKRKRSSILSI